VLAAWCAGTDHDIAVDCGRSGLVVMDLDRPEKTPQWLTDALESATAPYQSSRPDQPGRGHHIFAQPPERRIGCLFNVLEGCGEVKGIGGVVIVAPSHHRNGQYRWHRSGAIPVLPDAAAAKVPDAGENASAVTDAEVATFLAVHKGTERPELINGWCKTKPIATSTHSSKA
jgi:Bifunctional DNA primase/polymerase, N-terminal